jgi:hypothetical protein
VRIKAEKLQTAPTPVADEGLVQRQRQGQRFAPMADRRAAAQGKMLEVASNSPRAQRLGAYRRMAGERKRQGPSMQGEGVVQAFGWEVLGGLNPRRHLPLALGGYTDQQMAENARPEQRAPDGSEQLQTEAEGNSQSEQGQTETGAHEDDAETSQNAKEAESAEEADRQAHETGLLTANQYHALALAIFGAAVAWQTYRARQGKATRGRGAEAAKLILKLHGMDDMIDALKDHAEAADVETMKSAHKFYRNPFLEGVKGGLDPWPMPVAQEYAPWNEVLSTMYRVAFLVTATRAELHAHKLRVAKYAAKRAGLPLPEQGGDQMDDPMRLRDDGRAGFVAGVLAGSQAQAYVPVLSDPMMFVQVPWDTYNVLNMIAIKCQQKKQLLDHKRQAQRIHIFEMRLLRIQGQRKIHPDNVVRRVVNFGIKIFSRGRG